MNTPRRLEQLLEASTARSPDATAVEDAETGLAISYGQLDALSGRMAELLRSAGVRPGDRVGICAPKSIGTVAAIFAVLKARAAYVPVDVGAPVGRSAYILDHCSIRALFVAPDLSGGLRATLRGLEEAVRVDGLAPYDCELDLVRVGDGDEARQEAMQLGENLSYILYTSGSTGKPKGVVHTHQSALSFVDWCSDTFLPSQDDRFSSHAPFHFDLSILDLYVPIKHGAALVLFGEAIGKQPVPLAAAIAKRRISLWYSTPSILRLLLEFGRLDEHDHSSLRIVLFAGEVFPIKHLRSLREKWPHPRYLNLYGPTETNVCTWYELLEPIPDTGAEPLPIGRVCWNDRAMVVDEMEREVGPGVAGELYVTGGSVMQGYWNLPDRTATAFYVDPEGTRWYRTGDLVQEDGAGNYRFLGRRDRMVKRRGYRVELGEIEAVLYGHPFIREAAVVASTNEEGVTIQAHVAWDDQQSRPSLVEIKQFCSRNLPLYMIPDRFIFRDALPRTSTDKIDYQTLTALA